MTIAGYRVEAAVRIRGKIYTQGAWLPFQDAKDPEIARAIELGLIVASKAPPPAPKPVASPEGRAGVYIVSSPGGLSPSQHSTAIAAPGTLLWLEAEAAARLRASVRPLDLHTLLGLEPQASTAPEHGRSKRGTT